ncbi:MAG: radical SAM protein [Bacteroidetes bacterium]|nr:radical SAM protein [Bacteroidota bacterium]
MSERRLLLVSLNHFTVPYPVYPLGISYLSCYLRKRLVDFDIRVFDFNLSSIESFIDSLNEFKPDYTCVSLRNIDDVDSINRNYFIHEYLKIIEVIKQTINTRIIIGGAAFSIFPKLLFELMEPDFGIFGEGEESLYKLLMTLDNGSDYSRIQGLVYKGDKEIHLNPRNSFLEDPDLSFEKELIDFYWEKSGMMNIQTKRGCPHHCIYCTYPLIEGSRVRTLNIGKIIETLSDLYFNKKISYVFFTDSVFNIHNRFNKELAEQIIKAGIKMNWGAYFSPHDLDEETLRLYAAAGLTHIEFGTESLSDSTLQSYRKHFTVSDVVEVSALCNKVGIYFSHFMILGGYGETEKSIDEGFENSKQIENTVFFPYIGMRVYPGTKLYDLALEEGYYSKDDPLLEPVYYLAPDINYLTLKERADKTGRRWVFPDEDVVTAMNRMRQRHRKGSLWHHLKK